MEPQKNNLKIVADKKNARMILPNMLTLIGVCIGLTSIRFALDGRFELAIIAIIFAALIDGLDGRIARLIKGTSKVGKELDSLTDMISFGVAPAFIMYFWKLNNLGRFGWLLCLIYVICVALRLARFNINSSQDSSWKDNFFEGVPSPAGGILVLTPLIFSLTSFDFIEQSSELGSNHILSNRTSYAFNDNNFILFSTRRNKEISLTEYYNFSYEYKNDCLVAGIKYNKTFYQDNDLKPSENLFFTITLIPLTTYERRIYEN